MLKPLSSRMRQLGRLSGIGVLQTPLHPGQHQRSIFPAKMLGVSKNHALVCIEDLKVANMSRSAKGSKEQPGRNVKAKSGLNRSILAQGWSAFRRQLEYKQGWLGGLAVAVPPQHTSQRCSCCGHVDAANRLSQKRLACVSCRYEVNADFNAALTS